MKAKEMMANWLYSDVRIPYSVGVTFTILVMLFAVFVFGQSVVTSGFSEDSANHLYANELFLLAFFLIFFTCVLIILSYIPHGIYCIYKKATRHSKDIRKIKRFALSKYTIVFPFVVFGLLLLHLALQMWYGDYLYHHVIFDRDVMIAISVTTVTVVYGIIFGVTAHYFWILLHGIQKKHRYKKISRHFR